MCVGGGTTPNEAYEASTGNHVGHKGRRTSLKSGTASSRQYSRRRRFERTGSQHHSIVCGEMLEGLSGSSGRGLHGEKRRELGRPWKFLGVRSAHSTSRQASRSPEEGADGVMQPAQETLSGHAGLEQTMPTSLQGRAKKAAHEKSYRFRNFFGMLTVAYVLSGWSLLNKRAASGDRPHQCTSLREPPA